MSRSCESCGHFESHEPRTASLSSGRCPKCGCLSGWQKPEFIEVYRDEATQSAIFGTLPGSGPSWVATRATIANAVAAELQHSLLGVAVAGENGGAGSVTERSREGGS